MEYNVYSSYNPYNQQPPQKPKRESGLRTLALVLAGAVLGSLIGGGIVGLVLSGRDNGDALTAAQRSYIDAAVAERLKNTEADILPLSTGSGEYSGVQAVAEAVMPSVVGVRTVESVWGFWQDREVEGVGTGIIVSSDGLILTNQHVVSSNPKSITVTLLDGSEHSARVLFSDETMDLAVIKIDATGLKAARLGNSDAVAVGETAIAIGNPLGLNYQRSVTAGIVSALGRSILISRTQIAQNLIQTDAAINSGNSGGPLLNSAGEVIGINSYKLKSGEGMGFAIPVNVVTPVIEQILNTGSFSEAKLGVSVIDKELLNYYENSGITLDSGLYVYDVDALSDAYAKGLRAGDVITSVGGVEVNTLFDLKKQLYSLKPGDIVSIKLLRNGSETELSVMLLTA
ncbi:MAG: S1C family serine protease [Burkholderiales bacterium]